MTAVNLVSGSVEFIEDVIAYDWDADAGGYVVDLTSGNEYPLDGGSVTFVGPVGPAVPASPRVAKAPGKCLTLSRSRSPRQGGRRGAGTGSA